jgi:Lrp/AsnC family leucine-responsive transcriptional regulator
MPLDDFKARVQAWPEVVACFAMTGEMDYLLRVHVEDLQHFSRFVMEQLLMQPGVIDVKSSFALDRVKDTTALPLRQLGV